MAAKRRPKPVRTSRTEYGIRSYAARSKPPIKSPAPPPRRAVDDLRDIVKNRLDEMKISAKAAETIACLTPDTIRNVLRGRSPSYDKLLEICEALDMRLTIEPVETLERKQRIPRPKPVEAADKHPPEAAGLNTAKNDAAKAYYTSAPRAEIVDRLRGIPEETVAETIDEMVKAMAYEDAEELRSMAFEAGHSIW